MSLSKSDYTKAKGRVDAGEGSDDDVRIVKWWPVWHGNSSEKSSDTTESSENSSETDHPSSAPTTEPRSSKRAATGSTARLTGGRGQTSASSEDDGK